MTISLPADATTPYLGLNFTVEMKCSCASIFFFSFPKFKSHTRMLLSSEHEYKYFPDTCRESERTQLSCP